MRRPLAIVPPVRLPYDLRGLGRAVRDEWSGERTRVIDALRDALRTTYASPAARLVDSGTSALALAFEACARGGDATIAAPAYCCPDLITAAQLAGVRLRLYDLDPDTLAPDLASLGAAVDAGVAAVLVTPLFGYPVPMPPIRAIAERAGALVIEDVAQAAGGSIDGRLAGTWGDLAVLSFGRGKGIGGGGGGALLDRHGVADGEHAPAHERASLAALTAAALQMPLTTRWLFAVPSAIPALKLGEAVYHPPGRVGGMTTFAASLALRAVRALPREVARRAAIAARVSRALADAGVSLVRPVGAPGWLRLAARVEPEAAERAYGLGVRRPYTRLLHEYAEGAGCVEPPRDALGGAHALARTLVTVPVHDGVTASDARRMATRLGGAS